MESSSAAPGAQARPVSEPAADLVWRGRVLPPARAGALFVAGSLAIVVAGLALNYTLTGGLWTTPQSLVDDDPVDSPFGPEGPYLTTEPYDLATLAVLLASLGLLGAGFFAAYNVRLSGPWFALVAATATGSTLAWLARTGGLVAWGEPLLWLALAGVFGFLALTLAASTLVGTGPRMHALRALGFAAFGFYWASQIGRFYVAERGDFTNAALATLAVPFFNYFAYHELLSRQRNDDPRSLHWLAGAAFLATGVYVATHKVRVVAESLILVVAQQTTWLLQWFGQDVHRQDSLILYNLQDPALLFPIEIILACTAVQSIMIFVGGIAALRPPRRGDGVSGRPTHFERLRPTYNSRRFYALLLTVPLIYSLNLLRNVVIISLSANGNPPFFSSHAGATAFVCQFTTEPACAAPEAAFWFAHNIIGKGGSLVALVIIAYMAFQILPELYDSAVGLVDLKERRGPLERWFGIGRGRRGAGGRPARDRTAAPTSPPTPVAGPVPDSLGER